VFRSTPQIHNRLMTGKSNSLWFTFTFLSDFTCHFKLFIFPSHSLHSKCIIQLTVLPALSPLTPLLRRSPPAQATIALIDDWSSPRPSSVYLVNDVMHIEVSVLTGSHIPLRVFVDHCEATADPSAEFGQRYAFVNNHGCFMDSKLTGAKSFFLQRIQEDKLHFILQTFRFRQQLGNSMYISCSLKATSLSVPIDTQHKACSFLNEAQRWVASEGDNKVCACCESGCGGEERTKRSLEQQTVAEHSETLTKCECLKWSTVRREKERWVFDLRSDQKERQKGRHIFHTPRE
ncbi:hypothetical protein WMY93_034371, partial [Mugilogobius chulae]